MELIRRLVAVAIALLSIGLTTPAAFAQLPPTPEAPAGQLYRLEVTATRIKLPGIASASPISSYSAEVMEYQQPASVEEFMRTLPANQASIGPGTNNGTAGAATIDLRGLGSNRTLVLIDGRRVTPFDLFGSVNTDVIPLALLHRTDIVTGGATAVYGPDAIAGVANFILKKDFRGFDVNTSWGTSEYGDGTRTRTDVTWGAGFDGGRGNVAMSFGYTKTQPIMQGNRSFGQVSISSKTGAPQGSNTAVPVIEWGDVFPGAYQLDPTTNTFVPVYASYNFNPLNYFQTPLDRTQAVAIGDYLVNSYFDLYGQFLFTKATVTANLAPTGSFLSDYMVPLGNPFLPAAARQQICTELQLSAADCANPNYEVMMALGRRFTELGPRINTFDNNFYQWTVGTKGDLIWNWTYDAYYSEGKSDQTQTRGNWGSFSKVQQALRATNPTTCLDTSNNCVPLDIFGAEGSITPAMLGFINLNAVLGQTVQQRVGSFSAQGDFGKDFKSPWSKEPISAAVGYDNRSLSAANRSDGPSQREGEVLGTGAPTPDRSGKYNIKELYGELQLPIITGVDWIRRLSFEGGYRESRFETAVSSISYSTWKLGGAWEPIQGMRFRGIKNKATRAPNIDELYAPLVTGIGNLPTDPCQGTLINPGDVGKPGTLTNLCVLTGVPASKVGSLQPSPTGQINALGGGNPNLGPEVSDIWTLGLVWQPSWNKGVTMTLDYYNIELNQAISAPSVTDVVQGCYSTTLNPTLTFNNFCALIGRNPNNGTFNGPAARGVFTPTSNLGYIKTAGWDLMVDYASLFRDLNLDPAYGRLDINFTGTWVTTYEFKLRPTSILRNCVGYYSIACNAIQSNGGPIFKQKFNQRTTWYVGDFLFTYNWIFLGSVRVEPGSGTWLPEYAAIPSYSLVNMAAQYNVSRNLKLNLSVNNVFNKQPPIVGNTIGGTAANSGNTFPQSYDVVGRFVTIGAELKF